MTLTETDKILVIVQLPNEICLNFGEELPLIKFKHTKTVVELVKRLQEALDVIEDYKNDPI